MLFSLIIVITMFNGLFFVGLAGLLFTYKSNFFVIISIETIFLAINLNFLFFSLFLDSIQGIIFIFYIIIISAVEMVILLSFFVLYYRRVHLLDSVEAFKNIKY